MLELKFQGNTLQELLDKMQEVLHQHKPITVPAPAQLTAPTYADQQQAAMAMLDATQQPPAQAPAPFPQQPTAQPAHTPMPQNPSTPAPSVPATADPLASQVAPTIPAQPPMTAPPAPGVAPATTAPPPQPMTPPPAQTANPAPGMPPQAPAPAYTLDQLAKAGAALAQSGKMEDALALLAKYGVQTVNQLPPEHYGNFATELRALGATV